MKFMSRMRSAVEWSKQMDLDEEEKAGVGREERQRGTWEEVEIFISLFKEDFVFWPIMRRSKPNIPTKSPTSL